MPKYSFIIPVYNGEKTIARLAMQILDQSYTDFELILVNDGSKDGSLKIVKDLAQQDSRIIALDKPNGGPSSARNLGLQKARGEFIIFCDGDDEINSSKLSETLQSAENSQQDMLVLGWRIVQKDDSGEIIATRELNLQHQKLTKNIKQKILKSIGEDGRMYNLWNKIYRAETIKKHELRLRENLRFGEDLLFNFTFLKHAKKIEFISGEGYYIYEEDSPTSVVGGSKLDYRFRQENLRGLNDFAKDLDDNYSKDLVNFVSWRWLVSYTLALCGSKKSTREQIRSACQAIKDQKLKPRNKSEKLSKSKHRMEIILSILAKIPILFWLAMKLSLIVKKYRRSRKNVIVKLSRI